MRVLFSSVFDILYAYVRSDGHGAKKWQSTDAGVQSHVLKSVGAFVGCLSNELLKLPPVKVISCISACNTMPCSAVPSYSLTSLWYTLPECYVCINMKIRL